MLLFDLLLHLRYQTKSFSVARIHALEALSGRY